MSSPSLTAFHLASSGRLDEAESVLRQAIMSDPSDAETVFNLGFLLEGRGSIEESEQLYRRSLALQPHPGTHLRLSSLLRATQRYGDAVEESRKATILDPQSPETHHALGTSLLMAGQLDEGRTAYAQAIRINPRYAPSRFALCMTRLKTAYLNEADIAESRAAYEKELIALARDLPPADIAPCVMMATPYFLPYQGLPEIEPQRVYGQMICRAMAAVAPSPPLALTPAEGEKIRLGIVCGVFKNHSVWKPLLKGWLAHLDRTAFQITGYYTGRFEDEATREAAVACDRFVTGANLRDRIIGGKNHVLIYPEIGIDLESLSLAAQRLAPVQCTTWGHPSTSGFPTIDYFISSELMEPDNAQELYSEKLIRLRNLSAYLYPPDFVPTKRADAPSFGYRKGAFIFWCGQFASKYLPRHDYIYPEIASRVKDCQFVFLRSPMARGASDILERRLAEEFARRNISSERHCVFLDYLSDADFILAKSSADVFLDSLEWSGCNSTLESLPYGKPLLTFLGRFNRGRQTAAIMKMMDVPEAVCSTAASYIERAVALANDPDFHRHASSKIVHNRHRIYCDQAAIDDLARFLTTAARSTVAQ